MYELIHKQTFTFDLLQLGKADQGKVVRALDRISMDPFGADVKKVLKDIYSNLYRYRVGDLRICYALGTDCVSLLAVGLRKQIYQRLRRSPQDTGAIAVDGQSAELQPAPRAYMTRPDDPIPKSLPEGRRGQGEDADSPEISGENEEAQTPIVSRPYLDAIGVPEEYHDEIVTCGSIEGLLDLDLPEQVKERLLHLYRPPAIEETEHLPAYQLPDLDELERDAAKALSHLLLALDDEQKRAASAGSRGPLLVRGGPGTGKSIVALYRIRNLYERAQDNALFEETPPKTLFVTFTKALTRVSERLLENLLGEKMRRYVTIKNIDVVAREVAGEFASERFRSRGTTAILKDKAQQARVVVTQLMPEKSQVNETLNALPIEYILDEFQWVLDGRAIETVDEYLSTNRAGRGTRFGPELRRVIWRVYNTWLEDLEESGIATYEQVMCEAEARARALPEEEKYDVVVLDEAQDLKPIGIRLALSLCKSPEGYYMTADENQSIYGRGYSWRQVSSDLRVQGRSIVLRHNYRTTQQIQDAAVDFLHHGADREEPAAVAVHQGPRPIICVGVQAESIVYWFKRWGDELRLPMYMGAVLSPTNAIAEGMAHSLRELGVSAKAYKSEEMDIDAPSVKCLTIHTAKGLEFPFVAVAGLTQECIPRSAYKAVDEDDWQAHVQQERQLLHVAMTRAMWRLLLCKPETNPSPFFQEMDAARWETVS